MPRKPRIEYAGAVYHVMSRGNGGHSIFVDDVDRRTYLDTLGEACERCGWRIHAYVLMGNHYHLLLETPEPNLVTGMKWLQGTFTQRFNARHQRWGHLFQGRYKALPIHAESEGYWISAAAYIHLNPARARLLDLDTGELASYPWSSYPAFLTPRQRPCWLNVARVLQAYHWQDDSNGRRAYALHMRKRVLELRHAAAPASVDETWKRIRRGWYLGPAEFKQQLEGLVDSRLKDKRRSSFSGDEVALHDERMAEEILKKAWGKLNRSEADILTAKKSSDEKCLLAWLLRRHTAVSNDWISRRLQMGRADCLSRYPRRIDETREPRLLKLREKLAQITKIRD